MKEKIIAHRGVFDNKKIPENSISSFKEALKLDFPIELDVQLTSDDVLVVFHDFNLKRMTNKRKFVQDLSYNELKNLKLLNTNENIPTLEQVLSLVNSSVLLNIEIKNTNRIKKTCDILMKQLNNYDNYIIQSFNPIIVKYIKKKYPSVKVGLLISDNYNNKIYKMILTSNIVFRYCRPDFMSISKRLLKKRKFQKLARVLPTFVWIIERKEEITNNKYTYICNNLPYL